MSVYYYYYYYYLPPGSGDFPAFTPAEAGTRFSDSGGMKGWVDLGAGQNSLPAKYGHIVLAYLKSNRAVSWLEEESRKLNVPTTVQHRTTIR